MKTKLFFVALILAAQVAAIFFFSLARERERAESPTFRFECVSFDPRDLLRGHYLPLNFRFARQIPFAKFDEETRKKFCAEFEKWKKDAGKKGADSFSGRSLYWELWLVLEPNAGTGFYEVETVKTSFPAAAESEGKIVIKTDSGFFVGRRGNASFSAQSTPEDSEISFFWEEIFPGMRFYLSEEKAKRFDRIVAGTPDKYVVSADLYRRTDGTFHLKTLFVNDVPASEFLENLPEK